jgi:hypothetical protein
MARKFIDSGLFIDEWFSELSKDGKLFWIYYLTACDNAGFLKVNRKLINFHLDVKDCEALIKELGNRLIRVKEHLLFCPKYVAYQYPKGLSANVKPQKSVLDALMLHEIDLGIIDNLTKGLAYPYQRVQDTDKDTDKDKDKATDKGITGNSFELMGLEFPPKYDNNGNPITLRSSKLEQRYMSVSREGKLKATFEQALCTMHKAIYTQDFEDQKHFENWFMVIAKDKPAITGKPKFVQ